METKTKKPRALPHVWSRFFNLRRDDEFFIGRYLYGKTSPFGGHRKNAIGYAGVFVWPWTKVKTNVLVRDVYVGGKGDRLKLPEFAKDLPTKPSGLNPTKFDHDITTGGATLTTGPVAGSTTVPAHLGDAGGNFTFGGHDLMSPEEVVAHNSRCIA